jgi:hypothetical protein
MDEEDELMQAVLDDDPSMPVDEFLFRQSQAEAYAIFLERRGQYGSHIENAKRFPHEDRSGLYLKAARIIRDIENGDEIKDDTLIDAANYCHIIRSARGSNE